MFKQYVMQLRQPALVIDEQYHVFLTNHSFSERLGYTLEENLQKSLQNLVKACPKNHHQLVTASSLIFVTATGEQVTFSTTVDPIITEEGIYYFILCEEVFKSSSNLMNQSSYNELLKRALDHSKVGIVITDPSLNDNPIVYMNEGFRLLTGYSEDEVIGKNCRFLQGVETDPMSVQKVRNAIHDMRAINIEIVNYKKNGEKFWNELHIDPVYIENQGRYYFFGVQKEVTQRRRIQEDLTSSLNEIKNLSTPIVPISEGISVLPLIGIMDQSRWMIIEDSVLQWVSQHGEEQLIIDLSGLNQIEDSLHEKLLKLSKMLKLMGTQIILTGIRPNVALTNGGITGEQFGFKAYPTVKVALKELNERNES
ncbi:PAS domain-containing protein [Bacillaceae bacterium SIJ1]|uniref:PAS domain-containing protein n=1 Tax=Litoribacterium kuwaitense TaxID=1398745 RepID=UPI0013EAA4E3|nr:PAS domain-containing protein [Litoribacterium kuwaitense]NGP45404.1 PAS domain-containing protein [Litoribacterium kuwaitense]